VTRRLQRCRYCSPDPAPGKFSIPRGFTRHADLVCSRCRDPWSVERRQQTTQLRLLDVANPAAPTFTELMGGVDLSGFLAHGTDCPCPGCQVDRIPGRHA